MTENSYSDMLDRADLDGPREYQEYAKRTDTESQLLETLCLEFDIDPELIRRLIELEIENERRMRRRGLRRSLKKAIEDYTVEREDDYSQD